MSRSSYPTAILIAALVFAAPAGADAAAPEVLRVLCLSDSPADDSWAAELEERLNEAPRSKPFVVIRRAFTDGDAPLLSRLLDSYAPAFVVSRQPLSKSQKREVERRGMLLRVERTPSAKGSTGADKTARRIMAGLGAVAAPEDPSQEARLASLRRRAQAHLEFSEDAAAEAAFQKIVALAPDDHEASLALIRLRRHERPWGALEIAARLTALPGLTQDRRADAWLAAAGLQALVGDSAAVESYENVLRLRAEDPEALLGLAGRKRARPHEALRYAERAVASSPRRAAARRLVAEIQLDLDKRLAAKESLARALALDPEDLDSLALMVRALSRRPASAEAYVARAVALAEKAPLWLRPDAYRLCARMRIELGEYSQAARLYNRALSIDPEDLNSLDELARLRHERPQDGFAPLEGGSGTEIPSHDLSEPAARRALEDDPRDLEALHQLIAIRRDEGRLSEASALAKRFFEAVPSAPAWQRPSAYRLLSRLAWEAGDPKRAWLAARQRDRWALDEVRLGTRPAGGALEYESSEVRVAEARAGLGDQDGAARRLNGVLEVFPEDLHALNALLRLRVTQRRFTDALVCAQRLVKASAHAPPWRRAAAYVQAALVQLELKDEAGAQKSLARSLRHQDDGPALPLLLKLALSQRRFGEALRYSEKLESVNAKASPRERAAAHEQTARIRLELGDEAGAEKNLRAALNLSSEGPALPMLLRMALSHRRFGEALTHAEALEKSITRAPPEERAAALAQKARIQLELNDEAGAEKSLARSLRLFADGPALRLMLELVLRQRRFSEALPLAEKLRESNPQAPPRERAASWIQAAQIQLELKDEAGAEKSLREALRLDAEGPAMPALLQLMMAQRRFPEALSWAERLERAGARAPARERAASLARKAQIQLQLDDEDAAEKSLRESIRLDARGPALPMLLHLAAAQRRFPEALSWARRLEKATAKSGPRERAAAHVQTARIQLGLMDEAGAEISLRRSLSLQGDGPALPLLLDLTAAQRRFPEALAYAERMEKANARAAPHERAAAYARKAQLQLELKDEAGAEASLIRSLALHDDGPALPLLLQLSMSQRRFSEALSYAERLERASAQAPPRARAAVHARKAMIQLELKDEAGAEGSLERALSLGPGDMEVLWMLFDVKRRNPREVLRAVRAGKPSEPGSEAGWLALLGQARALNGDRAGARRDFSAAVSLDPEAVCLGPSFEKRRGMLDPLYFDSCLERFPASAALHSDRGVARYLTGERDAALADFRAAVALEPGHLAAHLNLLSLLAGENRKSEAREAADAAVAAAGGRPSPMLDRILDLQRQLRETLPDQKKL